MSGKDTKANEASKATKAPASSAQSTGVRAPATETVNGGALPTAAPTAAPTPIVTAPPGLPPPGLGQATRLPKASSAPLDSDGAGPAPPPTLTEMLENLQPQPDPTLPLGARRLVMEQLRDDQGVRIPWGWKVNKWVIIEEFKNGFPVWESHIFWGKFVPDEIEVVRVRPQRQLIFYSQYRFLQELPTLYLESISKAPEATKKIAAPRILPGDQHVPTNDPFVMGRRGVGCRMPSSDEKLPINMYPRFEAVLRPGVRKVGQAHVDMLLLIAYQIGLIAKPEMVYYKTDESGLDMMPIRLNPVFEEPAMQFVRNREPLSVHDLPLSTTDLTESIDSLELHSIPSSKAASVRNDAGEDVLGESDKEEGPGRPATAPIPPTNQQEAPSRIVTAAGSTSSKKKDAPSPATTTIPPSKQQGAPPRMVTAAGSSLDWRKDARLPATATTSPFKQQGAPPRIVTTAGSSSDWRKDARLPATTTTSPSKQQGAPPRMVTAAGSTSDKKKDAPSTATTTIPPTNQQEAPPLDVTTSNTTPDKKEDAPPTATAASSEDVSTAIPVVSVHDLVTSIEELTDSDDEGEETGGVLNAETMTAMVNEKLGEIPAPTLDDIVEVIQDVQESQEKKPKKKKKSPPVPRKLREKKDKQENSAMEQLLSEDPALQVTLSSFPNVIAHYIEQQVAARRLFLSKKKMPRKMDEAIKDILDYVKDNETTVWSEQEKNARDFITERKKFHRFKKNVQDFFLWREFEALLELPEVLVQDMCFLDKAFKGSKKYVADARLKETQYLAALFRIKELGSILSPSEERVDWDIEHIKKTFTESMEQYLHYMSVLRKLPDGYDIKPLNLTKMGIASWKSWHELKDSFLERKSDVKKRHQKSFLGLFANLHLEYYTGKVPPEAIQGEASLRVAADLLKNAKYHPVFAFDCYFIQAMLTQHGEQNSRAYWWNYFHEVFRTKRSIGDIKK